MRKAIPTGASAAAGAGSILALTVSFASAQAVLDSGGTPAAANLMDRGPQSVVIGGQRIGIQALLDLQRDARRYRWLRDDAGGMLCTAAPMVASLDAKGDMAGLLDGEELDAAVDMAMTPAATRRAAKTKRMENTR